MMITYSRLLQVDGAGCCSYAGRVSLSGRTSQLKGLEVTFPSKLFQPYFQARFKVESLRTALLKRLGGKASAGVM